MSARPLKLSVSVAEHSIGASKSMDYNDTEPSQISTSQIKRLPLGRSRQRLSFERRLRLSLYLMGLPVLGLVALELNEHHIDSSIQWIALPSLVVAWLF